MEFTMKKIIIKCLSLAPVLQSVLADTRLLTPLITLRKTDPYYNLADPRPGGQQGVHLVHHRISTYIGF